MSTLEFIAQMAQALGWPLSVIILVLVLRRPIVRMLVDRPTTKVKAGPLDLIWDTIVSKAETEVPALPPATTVTEPSVRREFEGEANAAPPVAVLAAYVGLEHELRRMLSTTDMSTEAIQQAGSAVGLARLARQEGLITRESVNAVAGAAVLRNLVAHGSGSEITPQQANEYLALIDAIMYALRTGA